MKSFTLEFEGYWLEGDWGSLPSVSGLYCVYACTFDSAEDTVSIKRLLYVGESGNVRNRVPEKPKNRRDKWARELKSAEVLCVSCATISASDRDRVEAATIYRHKPTCNEEYVDSFPWPETKVSTSGRNAKLAGSFAVERTA